MSLSNVIASMYSVQFNEMLESCQFAIGLLINPVCYIEIQCKREMSIAKIATKVNIELNRTIYFKFNINEVAH